MYSTTQSDSRKWTTADKFNNSERVFEKVFVYLFFVVILIVYRVESV